MLFNPIEFLFLFLPVLLIGFFRLACRSHRLAAAWLALGTLFFYAWWDPTYVAPLLAFVVFNLEFGDKLCRGG